MCMGNNMVSVSYSRARIDLFTLSGQANERDRAVLFGLTTVNQTQRSQACMRLRTREKSRRMHVAAHEREIKAHATQA
jgi:hypothetical protein